MICWIAVNKLLYDQLAAGCGDGSERSNEATNMADFAWPTVDTRFGDGASWARTHAHSSPYEKLRENKTKRRNEIVDCDIYVCVSISDACWHCFHVVDHRWKKKKNANTVVSIVWCILIEYECKLRRTMWGYSSATISRLSMTSANNNRPTKILIPFMNIEHTEHAPSVRRVK